MSGSVREENSLERIVTLLETHNPSLFDLFNADSEDKFIDAAQGALEREVAAAR